MRKALLRNLGILLLILVLPSCELFWDAPETPALHVLIVALDYSKTEQIPIEEDLWFLNEIPGPVVDAHELARALHQLGTEEFFDQDVHITLMTEEAGYTPPDNRIPSRQRVASRLEQYQTEVGEQDTFLLYYAGHGGTGAPMILASETGGTLGTYFTPDEIRSLVSEIPGNKAMIFDTCHSGQIIYDYPRTEEAASYDPHMFIISASAADETSQENAFVYTGHNHGWFSYTLLEALGWDHYLPGEAVTIDGRELTGWGNLTESASIPTLQAGEILLGTLYRYITWYFSENNGWITLQTPHVSEGPTDLVLFSDRWSFH
jgi:hypothetical protein